MKTVVGPRMRAVLGMIGDGQRWAGDIVAHLGGSLYRATSVRVIERLLGAGLCYVAKRRGKRRERLIGVTARGRQHR